MALLSRLFQNRRNSRNSHNKWEPADPSKGWSGPEFDKSQIRLVVYTDHDLRGQTLLFDSKAVHRVEPGEVKKPSKFRMRDPPASSNNGSSSPNAPPKYKYTRVGSDTKMLGEMMFGSVAMAYKGSTLKVHSIRSPSQIMVTKVFVPLKTNRESNAEGESLDSLTGSIHSGSSESRTPQKDIINAPRNNTNIAQSVPVDVPTPPKRDLFLEGEDSGFSASASVASSASSSLMSSFPSPDTSASSHNSSFNNSYNSMHRRWMRNQMTSLEHNLRKRASDEGLCEPVPASKRPPKIGIGILFVLPEMKDDTAARHFEKFFFSHITLLERHVNKLKVATEKGFINKKAFVHTVVEALDTFRETMHDLYSAPRLMEPVWLNMMCFVTHRVPLCQKFLKEFMVVVEKYDTKNTKFFVSTLVTAVLTHHLAWVPTVTPAGATPSRTYLDKHSAKWLDALARSHPYNPLWAQLGDLYGAIGFPLRLSRTVVVGKKQDLVSRILYVLSYFIRCSEMLETTEEKMQDEEDEEEEEEEEEDEEEGLHRDSDMMPIPESRKSSQGDIDSQQVAPLRAPWDIDSPQVAPLRAPGDIDSPQVAPLRAQDRTESPHTELCESGSTVISDDKSSFIDHQINIPHEISAFKKDFSDKQTYCDSTESINNDNYLRSPSVLSDTGTIIDSDENVTNHNAQHCRHSPASCTSTYTTAAALQYSNPNPQLHILTTNCTDHVTISSDHVTPSTDHVTTNTDHVTTNRTDCIPSSKQTDFLPACHCLQHQNTSHNQTVIVSESKKCPVDVERLKLVENSEDENEKDSRRGGVKSGIQVSCDEASGEDGKDVTCQLSPSRVVECPRLENIRFVGRISTHEDNDCSLQQSSPNLLSDNIKVGFMNIERVSPPSEQLQVCETDTTGDSGVFEASISDIRNSDSKERPENCGVAKSGKNSPIIESCASAPKSPCSCADKSTSLGDLKLNRKILFERNNSMFDEYFTESDDSDNSLPKVSQEGGVGDRLVKYKRLASVEGSNSIFDEYMKVPCPDVSDIDDHQVADHVSKPNQALMRMFSDENTSSMFDEYFDDQNGEDDGQQRAPRPDTLLIGRVKRPPGYSRQSSNQSTLPPGRCRPVTPTELGRRRHASTLSTGSSMDTTDFFLNLKEVTMPRSEGPAESGDLLKYERNFGRSLLAGYHPHYLSDFVLHGTSDENFQARLHNDLTMAVQDSVLDEPIAEAACIVADTDKWSVRLQTCQYSTCDRVKCNEMQASQLVCNIIESVHHLWKLKMSPEFCLMHLEDRLQEIYFKSKMIADYICSHKMIDPKDLATVLEFDLSDLPLLLAVAGTHTSHFALGLMT